VLRVGSPGSVFGPSLVGVGVGVSSPAGVGAAVGVGVTSSAGVGAGDGPGYCGKACSPSSGVALGDAAGTCAQRGAEIAARDPTAIIKRRFAGTNLLMGISFE